jgi:hypothetical protein
VILRCTKKLLDIIGPKVVTLAAPPPEADDWYANLLWFERRKCLLLTHQATLFTIFEPDVTADGLRAAYPMISRLVVRELRNAGLPEGTFGDLAREDVIFAKPADRSVLGCMNDMAVRCAHILAADGGLARTDIAALNRSLRRNINSARGYQTPLELARRYSAR